jgi:uncharacterized GH25 family protein
MSKIKKSLLAGLILLLSSTSVMAHTMWVNLFRSTAHEPGHALVSLGWGHTLPLDDLLMTSQANLKLGSYELVDPDLVRTALPMPVIKMEEKTVTTSGVTVQKGDMGIRKLSLGSDTKPGTYQVTASAEEAYFTSYINQDGRTKMATLPIDEIKDLKEVVMSMKFGANAKSFMAVKEWTPPQPLGYDLEIIPTTDLTNVRAGDLVTFEIKFMGKAIQRFEDDTIQYITATSNSFGGPDGFFISSFITKGKGQFRMPAAGQWVANVYFKQQVAKNDKLKDLADKCTCVYHAASVSFMVKP